eukprot:GILI01021042.1.p1 GENE.GILI01021042.1~~GILI01021042.1.p1  ORF type:complete len:416 (+),score=43.85 GILI01021042.1:34-1248(+)
MAAVYINQFPSAPMRAFYEALNDPTLTPSESATIVLQIALSPECGVNRRSEKREGTFGTGNHVWQLKHATTPFLVAAELGRLDVMQALVDKGADPLAFDNRTLRGALHKCAAIGNAHAIKYLISIGADLKARDKSGWTPLVEAACYGQIDAMAALIDSGASVTTTLAGDHATPLLVAATFGQTDAIRFLLARGATISDQDTDADGEGPLHKAARSGHHESLVDLIEAGAPLNQPSLCKDTPLHVASIGGHPQVTSTLVQYGADITVVSDVGQTPLHYAVLYGSDTRDEVQSLLDYGADCNVSDRYGITAFHKAVEKGDTKAVSALLDHGADIEFCSERNNDSPLHLAAKYGAFEVIKLIVWEGACITVTNLDRNTPRDLVNESLVGADIIVKLLTPPARKVPFW